MPRYTRSPLASDSYPFAALDKFDFVNDDAADVSLFFPRRYEKNYAYPTLVWLHGPGDDQRQVSQVMPHISGQNYMAVGPQAPAADEELGRGYCWQETPDEIELSVRRVFDAIEVAGRRASVDAERIFIGGYQCGGNMAIRVAMLFPETFRGAISLGAGLPKTGQPLVNVDAVRKLPLFIGFGEEARLYGSESACNDLKLAHAAHLNLMLRQYPCGDELRTPMLTDVNHWMMEIITGQPMPEQTPTPADSDYWN